MPLLRLRRINEVGVGFFGGQGRREAAAPVAHRVLRFSAPQSPHAPARAMLIKVAASWPVARSDAVANPDTDPIFVVSGDPADDDDAN